MSEHSYQQAAAQLESVRALVMRLEHANAGHTIEDCVLVAECPDCDDGMIKIVSDGEIVTEECATCNGTERTWDAGDHDGLTFDEYHDEDEASEAISADPLSVEVRSGWTTLGNDLEPEEYAILLCTGGPAVRIRGELDSDGNPCRAWIEYQDWGTPWREYHDGHDAPALLAYAGHFLGGF